MKITCDICRRFQEDAAPGYEDLACGGIDEVDECRKIHDGQPQVPKLLPANRPAWELFCKISPGLFDGMGGVSYPAIDFCFRTYVRPSARSVVMDMMLIIIACIREAKEKANPNG